MTSNRAFTLIELITVIVVLGIVAVWPGIRMSASEDTALEFRKEFPGKLRTAQLETMQGKNTLVYVLRTSDSIIMSKARYEGITPGSLLAAKLQDTSMTPRTFPHLSLLPRPRPRTARRR